MKSSSTSKSKQQRRTSLSIDTSLNVEKQLRRGNSMSRSLTTSPRIISSTINGQSYGAEDAQEMATERALEDVLSAMSRLIFKAKAMETNHDLLTIQDQIKIRSKEIYESDLSKTVSKLELINSSNHKNHKLAALQQLSGRYLQDLERLIFTATKQELDSKTADLFSLREFSKQNDIKLRHEIVSKDQLLTRLQQENERLLNEKQECERNYITLQKEFDGSILRNAQVNQQMVEFRLRGLDLKSEVQRRAKRVLKSVESRLGFLPQDIVRNISYLSILKAPGDPEYDKVRVLSLAQSQSKAAMGSDIKSRGKNKKEIDLAIDLAFQNHQNEFFSKSSLDNFNGASSSSSNSNNNSNSPNDNKNIAWSPKIVHGDHIDNYHRSQDYLDVLDGVNDGHHHQQQSHSQSADLQDRYKSSYYSENSEDEDI